MADVGVDAARVQDAAEIGRIQVLTWRTAYLGILPAAVLDELDERAVANTWSDAIAHPPTARHRVVVAHEGDSTVGFAGMGPAAADEGDDAPVRDLAAVAELATLLVEPRWGRRGHGSRLLSASADLLRDDGFRTMVTWVLDEDTVTGQFLSSAGWEPDGEARVLDAMGRPLHQYRMHVSLDTS